MIHCIKSVQIWFFFSGQYLPVFRSIADKVTGFHIIHVWCQCEYEKTRIRRNFVFRHYSYMIITRQICKDGIHLQQTSPLTQDLNWTYIIFSEDVQDVFWTSHVRSFYVLCPRVEAYNGSPPLEIFNPLKTYVPII